MTPILEVVEKLFAEDGWPYSELEGQPVLRTAYKGENGQWNCYVQANEDDEHLLIYSVFPIQVTAAKREEMAEFLTRANYGLRIGNFEMDYDDGEIRYKTSVPQGAGALDIGLVRRLLHFNVLTMDRYTPGMMTILYGDEKPAAALAQIEG